MDGFGFLRHLRAKAEWRDIPVVVLTAKDVTAGDRRRLGGQADRILQKGGLSMADLAATLRSLISPPVDPADVGKEAMKASEPSSEA